MPNLKAVIYFKIKKILKRNIDVSKDRSIIINGKLVSIGWYTYGYENTSILTWGEDTSITIGRFCSISSGIKLFCGGNHRTDWISTYPFGHEPNYVNLKKPVVGTPASNGNIIIGNDVWIGRDVTILSGITVGDGAVIAANSHVASNVDPYTIVGGNPAKNLNRGFLLK